MAIATKRPPVKKKAEMGTLDYLERALEDLNMARATAQKGVRGQIDTAVDRVLGSIGDVKSELKTRAGYGR
jgi:hypothetical protein